MKSLRLLILLIAVITLITGLTQILIPGFGLGIVGVGVDATTRILFSIIGMFMFLFGGMLIHAVYNEVLSRVPLLWSFLQKLGASIAVSLGIVQGLFAPIAAVVAVFDFTSAILILIYLRSLK